MKKLFVSLFILVSLIIISSCSRGSKPMEQNETTKIEENIDTTKNVISEDMTDKTVSEDNDDEDNVVSEEETYTDSENNVMTEEEFNNSWSAKAIESETDLWNYFDDENVGFSLNYPPAMTLLNKDEYVDDLYKAYFKISMKDIWISEDPMDLSVEEEVKNIETLASWEFWENFDMIFDKSKNVKSVWFLFAQDYMVLSRFEVCDVTLERSLLFYYNNKQITLTSFAPINKFKELMPEYFTTDKVNCGEEIMWNLDKQNEFYETLINKEAPQEIQTWFDNFDKMSEAIVFDKK